jgi:small subunit ribosomal protein S2
MQDITLQALLEAGCHFGHKAERWNPKATSFIYTKKDGIHIIDLVKTKTGLEAAAQYIKKVVANGGEVLFVGTKRQARGILKQEAETVGAPYFSERWIGGFLTNWDQVRKNIEKINRMTDERAGGAWKKFPKHEQTKMSRYLERIRIYYGGVLHLAKMPDALFIVDVKKEIAAVREAKRCMVPIVAMVDTNSDPTGIDYVIPSNDDAVGAVTFVVGILSKAYQEGKDTLAKNREAEVAKQENEKAKTAVKPEVKPAEIKKEVKTVEKPKKNESKIVNR